MSRARNARRKAGRQQARAAAHAPRRGRTGLVSRAPVIPMVVIAGVLTATAVVGFGIGGGTDGAQANQDIEELLAGVPQRGNTLGSPDAPITLKMFADLQCPTVKMYAEKYLPSLISTWVRSGKLKLVYHSLKTDTADESMFLRQETAALAAGRQDRMWNFVLTFLDEQDPLEPVLTEYEMTDLLARVADRISGLNPSGLREGRADALLTEKVALGVILAHDRNFRSTPSFFIRYADGESGEDPGIDLAPVKKEFIAFFKRDFAAFNDDLDDLTAELARSGSATFNDTPAFGGVVP
ncbi:MAG TPA: thioredoxin domain-containing protein [Solirubrobacterales bacterium]|nr:thioredoxin domain-containing protein [Solirubrobacterales bacterium]